MDITFRVTRVCEAQGVAKSSVIAGAPIYAVFGVLLPALVAASAFAAADAESLRAVLARALFGASSPRASSPVYFV